MFANIRRISRGDLLCTFAAWIIHANPEAPKLK
jgi:hypothetical protein